MKYVIRGNVHSGKCSVWGNVRSGSFRRGNVCLRNCPFGKLFTRELSAGELSVGKVPLTVAENSVWEKSVGEISAGELSEYLLKICSPSRKWGVVDTMHAQAIYAISERYRKIMRNHP